jgi:hypothetical protein
VRVSVLAVGRHHVHSRVEVHCIDAVAAVDGVYARVVVSLDHISANSSAYLVDPSVISAYEVRAVPAEHIVVAKAAPDFVGSPFARGRVVAAVTLHSLATVEDPTGATRERIVTPVAADAVYAACAREVVVAATASNVVRTGGAYEGVIPVGAVEGRCQGHPLASSIATPMAVTNTVSCLTHSSLLGGTPFAPPDCSQEYLRRHSPSRMARRERSRKVSERIPEWARVPAKDASV